MKLIKTFKSLPMAVAAAAVLAAAPIPEMGAVATAQEQQQQETRKVPAISLDVHKKVQKAQEALDAKDLATAKELLAETLERKKINDYERAVVWQFTAMIAFEEDDTRGAIRAFEQMIRYKDSIPVALELSIMYNLSQLYYTIEDFDRSIQYVKDWEARSGEFVGVSAMTFISQLHYVRNEFPQAIEYIDRTIALAQTLEDVEVKENWYSLKLSSHYELEEFGAVRDTLETLLLTWPKPQYWIQLASVYQELGEEEAFYSLMEAAYKQGFLDDKEAQLITVAQIQISRDAPIKCAWVMDRGLNDKRIERTADNLRTLGQCYMQAAEFGKAIEPLTASAKLDADADLWFQIGQVQMAEDDLKGAVESFDQALDGYEGDKSSKAKEKAFSTMMLRAQALIELKRYKEARDAFSTANRVAEAGKQKRQVRQWRNYLKAEEEREKMLTGNG